MDYYRNTKKNPSNIILNPEEMDTTTLSIQDMDLTLMANTESKLSISFSDQILDDSCLELQDDFNTTKILLRKSQTKEINSICLENNENDFSTTDEEEEEECNVTILYNNSNNEKCYLSKLKLNSSKSKESSQDSIHNYSGNFDNNSASNLDDSIEDNLQIKPQNAEKFENHQAKIKLKLLNYLYNINSYTRFINSTTIESPFFQEGNVFNEVKTILNKNLTENVFISLEIDYNSFSCEDFVRINKERMNTYTFYNQNLLRENYLEFNENEVYLNEKYKEENIAINNETNSRSVEKSKNSTSCPSIESSDIELDIKYETCLNDSVCDNDSATNTDDIKTLLSSSLSPITTKSVSANDSKQLTTVLQFEKGSTDGSIILPIIDKENDKKYDNCKFSIFTEFDDNVPIINNSLEINSKSLLVKNETFKKDHSKNGNINKNEHFSKEFTVLEKLKKILGRYHKLFNKYRKIQQFSKLELELKSLVDELKEKFEMQNLNQEQRTLKESEVVNTFKVAQPKLFKSNVDKHKRQENNFIPNQYCTYSLRNKSTNPENVLNNHHKLLLKREIINDKAKKNKEITDYSDFAKLWKRQLSNNVKENKNSGIKEYVNKHVKYKEMKSVPVKTIKRNKNDVVLIKKEKSNTILEQKPTIDLSLNSNSTKIFPSSKYKVTMNSSLTEIKEKSLSEEKKNGKQVTFMEEPQIMEYFPTTPHRPKSKLRIRVVKTNRGEHCFREVRLKTNYRDYTSTVCDYKFSNSDILLSRTYTSRFHRNDPKKRLGRYQKHLLKKRKHELRVLKNRIMDLHH